ncbi:F-box/WD repeat-containing protein 9 isoform X2 [Solenopsis invicta]|uniref:F-box/WD repeat-containing protein 9 isoform X2 n=1 Tax=Solenopsis invicta TaxID=13686 RepID=UPI00193CFF34|nr:F-box/WD repeat-containing protein 9 isoform X2 [Solenopsis invicta]
MPSLAEARRPKAFILHVLIPGDLNRQVKTYSEWLASRGLSLQPTLLFVGPSLSNITASYVQIDTVRYELRTPLKALDTCFKAFHALDAAYQEECQAVWLFIQRKMDDQNTSTNARKKNTKKNIQKNSKKIIEEQQKQQQDELSLQDLPTEIFLHVCSFVDAETLAHSLSLVCKKFYKIIKDNLLWKYQIIRTWPNARYSPFLFPTRPDEQYMKLSYLAIKKQTALWKRWEKESMDELFINVKNTSNTLLQMHDGTTCIVAGSYYSLLSWKIPSHEELLSHDIGESFFRLEIKANPVRIDFVHNTEILDLTAIDNTIYSCSWNQTVKSCMLMDTGFVQLTTYYTNEPNCAKCISSCPKQSLFATGSERGSVFLFDSRLGHKPIRNYRPNNGPVKKLAMDSEYILSLNETVCVWDQRAGRTMNTITFPNEATCMSMQKEWVCVGDTKGMVHVLNPKNGFKLAKSISDGYSDYITGVHLTRGCLITSTTGYCNVSSLTDPSKSIAILLSEFYEFNEIKSMNYLNGTFTTSNDETIVVWRPTVGQETSKSGQNSYFKRLKELYYCFVHY